MSHFSPRPVHLFGLVRAKRAAAPFIPLLLLPSFAFRFIFNRATHHGGTRRSPTLRCITPGASLSLSPFFTARLSSSRSSPAPFFFLFPPSRRSPFSLPPPSRSTRFHCTDGWDERSPWWCTSFAYGRALVYFQGKGVLAVSSHIMIVLERNYWNYGAIKAMHHHPYFYR